MLSREVKMMLDASFAEQARQRTLDFFQAYCIDNNMDKVLSYFSKQSSYIGWGSQEIYPDYADIVATAHERLTIPFLYSLITLTWKQSMLRIIFV